MKVDMDAKKFSLLGMGIAAALMTAPSVVADPAVPGPPPAPVQTAAGDVVPPPPPPPGPDLLAFLRPKPAPAPAAAAPAQAAAPAAAPAPAPPAEVPHLPSPENLPPGSTMDPAVKGTEDPNISYLKDLWHAVQNQEISGKEAVIMGLAQRGMEPYPDQMPGPNVPNKPVDPAAAPPPPPPPPAPVLPWLAPPPPPAPAPPVTLP